MQVQLQFTVSDVYDPQTGRFSQRENRNAVILPQQTRSLTYKGLPLTLCLFPDRQITAGNWADGRCLGWAVAQKASSWEDVHYDQGEIVFLVFEASGVDASPIIWASGDVADTIVLANLETTSTGINGLWFRPDNQVWLLEFTWLDDDAGEEIILEIQD